MSFQQTQLYIQARKLVDNGSLEVFIDNTLDSMHGIKFRHVQPLHQLKLTTLGWALHNLGAHVDDKQSFAMCIGMGVVIARNTSVLSDVSLSKPYQRAAMQTAVMMVQELYTTGETQRVMNIDEASSGIQIMAAQRGCITSLETCIGKSQSPLDAFYSAIPDTYGTVQQSMRNDFLTPSQRRLMDKLGLDRNTFKAAMLPTFYGSSAAPIEAFKKNKILVAAFWKAMDHHLPVVMRHTEEVSSINFAGQTMMKFMDILGRKVYYQNVSKESVEYVIETPYGDVEREYYPVTPVGKDGIHIGGMANTVHNPDSVHPIETREALVKAHGVTVAGGDVHDAFTSTPENVNLIRATLLEGKAEIPVSGIYARNLTELRHDASYRPDISPEGCKAVYINLIRASLAAR